MGRNPLKHPAKGALADKKAAALSRCYFTLGVGAPSSYVKFSVPRSAAICKGDGKVLWGIILILLFTLFVWFVQ